MASAVAEARPAGAFTEFAGEKIAVVDIDSHYTEPADLWISRAPAQYRDLVPAIQRNEHGNEVWVVNGDVPFGPLGFSVVGRGGEKKYGTISLGTFEELDEAAYEPKARLRLLDRLGIHQQIIYPNVVGFGSEGFLRIKDDGLRMACATIYNDAVAELQRQGEGRLFPQAIIPFWDIEASVREARRAKQDLGLCGIAMPDKPQEFGLPYLDDPHWEPFWNTCQDLELPVNFHIGVAAGDVIQRTIWPSLGPQRRLAVMSVALFIENFRVIINLIFSGLLERFPKINFVSVESGIGWVPFLLEAMDYQFEETVPDERQGLKLKPSEYFRRQILASFWFEDFGPRAAIDRIGPEAVMFETDFPHPTCLYPKAQEHITEVLTDLAPDVRRKVLRENAVRVYHLPD